jgi:phosphate transport system substrate-binding protein
MKKLIIAALAVFVSTSAQAREYISIVGSSTVFPFSTSVAEKFGGTGKHPTPVIESTGSGGGMKLFCQGVGFDTPDITNASRAIKSTEADLCKSNGVTPVEYLIGYDGITFSNSKSGQQLSLTKEDIFNAVAENVMVNGKWVANPNQTWADVRSDLPNLPIAIMAPPPTSGTRDAFVELVMHKHCKKTLGLSKKEYKAQCTRLRIDGPVVEVGENDNLIIQKLQDDENRFGIFGFSFLDQNSDTVQPALVDGVAPSFDTIADGSYGISRPLYYYVKEQHLGVVAGIEEYVRTFHKMMVTDGPLSDMGLIPLQ